MVHFQNERKSSWYDDLGEMAEWSKALDSKSSRPQKGLEGSNPSLTATSLTSNVALPLSEKPEYFREVEDTHHFFSRSLQVLLL